MTKVFSFWPC